MKKHKILNALTSVIPKFYRTKSGQYFNWHKTRWNARLSGFCDNVNQNRICCDWNNLI